MKKLIFLGIILIFLTLSFVGCVSNEEKNQQESDQTINQNTIQKEIIKGVSISPKTYSNEDFLDFFDKVQLSGEAIRWGGDYSEFSKLENNSAESTLKIAYEYGLIPIIETNFFNEEDISNSLTDEQINYYVDIATDFAKENKPPYLSLGVEVNFKFTDSPKLIDEYAKVFDLAYNAIKNVSPDTKVFITFQLEWMKGLQGGLFGGQNNNENSQWNIIDKFPKADLIGFTTYPCLIYKSPEEIPDNYYTEIREYTSKPVIFTEFGWFASDSILGWESNEQEQADFINTFFNRTKDLKSEMNIWVLIFDQQIQEPFDSMGFFKLDGTKKDAWDVWLNYDVYQEDIKNDLISSPIVFMSRVDREEGELYLLNTDESIERLTNNNRHENNLSFSFDNTKIAFHAGDESNPLTWDIYILDLKTGEEIRITDNNYIDGHPDWSPNGDKLVFSSFVDDNGYPSGTADIYSVNIDGTNISRLTNSIYEDNDPEWSPDGNSIVYKSTEFTKVNGREEIYIMNTDGSNKRRLTATKGWQSDHDPSWSKDNKTITFERFEGSRSWLDISNNEILNNNLDELTP